MVAKARIGHGKLLGSSHHLCLFPDISLQGNNSPDAYGESQECLAPLDKQGVSLVTLDKGPMLTEAQDPIQISADAWELGGRQIASSHCPNRREILILELFESTDESRKLRIYKVCLRYHFTVLSLIGLILTHGIEALVRGVHQRD